MTLMNSPMKNPLFWLWLFYALFIVYGTLIPFDLVSTSESFSDVVKGFFAKGITPTHLSKPDLLSNFLLFIPYAFFMTGWLNQRGTNFILAISLALFTSFALSLSVELCQAYSPSRISSPGDLLINTAGGFAGAIPAAIYFPFFHERLRNQWLTLWHEKPILLITLIFGATLFLGGLVPFDVSIDVSDLKQALKGIEWIPFSHPSTDAAYLANMGTDFFLLIAFAGLCHLSLRLYAISLISFFIPTLILTLALAGIIEFSQLFIVSRQTDVTHLVLALVAGGIGSLLAGIIEKIFISESRYEDIQIVPSRSVSLFYLKLAALFVYSLVTSYFLLEPLDFDFSWAAAKSRLSLQQLVPFYAYWVRTDFYALQDLLFTIFLFVPFGAFIYHCLKGFPLARTLTLLVCILFSASLELLQFFQPGRYPDLTDILSAALGSFLGLWILRKFTSYK